MFHDVLPDTSASGGGPERFATTLASFERMLDVIQAQGRVGCSVEQAVELGEPCVAISFDDGAASQGEHALPALVARGMSATFYVATDWVGRPGYMSWSELRELRAAGMSVQSHTRSHPFLSELDEAALRSELTESKVALDRELGQETIGLSFPGGDAPARGLRHVLAESGYRIVAGSRWGVNRSGPVRAGRVVRRCTVRAEVSERAAERIVRGDLLLTLKRTPREAILGGIRSTMGPTRYARVRRRLLDAVKPG